MIDVFLKKKMFQTERVRKQITNDSRKATPTAAENVENATPKFKETQQKFVIDEEF
jgi:hypothetical protein